METSGLILQIWDEAGGQIAERLAPRAPGSAAVTGQANWRRGSRIGRCVRHVPTAGRMVHGRGMTVRWGVAGPGPVAGKVMRDLTHVPNAVLTAVGSRSAEPRGWPGSPEVFGDAQPHQARPIAGHHHQATRRGQYLTPDELTEPPTKLRHMHARGQLDVPVTELAAR